MGTAIVCPHCPWMEAAGLSHTKNCKCGHHHASHVSFSGCKINGCLCNRYDQSEVAVRVSKPKIVPTLEFALHDVNIDKLTMETETNFNAGIDLLAAQSRLDKLRIRKEELEKNMTH